MHAHTRWALAISALLDRPSQVIAQKVSLDGDDDSFTTHHVTYDKDFGGTVEYLAPEVLLDAGHRYASTYAGVERAARLLLLPSCCSPPAALGWLGASTCPMRLVLYAALTLWAK